MEEITLKLNKNKLASKNYLKKIVIFVFVFGIFILNPGFAEAAQFGRPASTVSAGSWTAVNAPTLHEATDEVTANDDTDYANTTVNTTAELKLSSVADPQVNSGHTVRWSFNPAGSGGAEQIVFDLYQGGTLIRSSGNINGARGTYNVGSFTLTGPEADSINDYSDLRLRITTPNLGASDSMRVTWLEFEVPDASVNVPPSLSIFQPDGVGDTVIVGDLYDITYTLSDPEEAVTAAFYYDTDATGLDGTAITGPCALALEGSGVTCAWDTTGISPGSYYIYGITNDGINPQVSAYSLGAITINIDPQQEILNRLDTLDTKIDNLQAQTDLLPQNIWGYANRSLTNFGTLVADIWSYSGRSLENVSNITQGVWEYSTRSLTSFGTLVADIWSYSGRSLENVSNITQGVWEYSDRTLTSGTSIAQDIWDATTRKLTSREITVGEYLAGVSSTSTVSQVADQPTQADVQYNVELVRNATFDFAGIADAGGSTLTLIDTELDQPNAYWNNYDLVVMSGSNIGQKRAISSFDKNTNTVTVSSAFSSPIASGDKYVISHEGKLVNAIWSYADRTLTGFGTLAADIWSYPNRSLTDFGTLVADIWNNSTRTLTSALLGGGGQLATTANLDTLKSDLITEINENQTLIQNLNNISAVEVWSYASRGLTEEVDLTATSSLAIWDVAKAELTTAGSIGKQIANNLDAAVSTRSTLTATDVWSESSRTLTDYATSTVALAVWQNATRELTNYGNNITAQDVWNVLSSTLTLQDSIGKQLAGNVDVAVSTRASQASLDALNDISAADVWSYANRSITDPNVIWDYALTQIGTSGSIGKLLKDNIDATISSRGTSNLTAADVWNSVTRTLTSNANFNDPDSATIAAAVWSEATRELTNYGNNITAQDVWNILSSNLTTSGTIGNQLAANVDATVSSRSTLTAAGVWGYANRSLTDFGTLVADIWNYSTRGLTTFGSLIADIWNNSTRTLTSALLGGGGQLATTADLNTMKADLITEINENQTLIENLNSITAAEVWSYASRGLTEEVDLTATSSLAIWDVAKAELTTAGSIGKQIANNLDAAVSTRSTLTAADVWNTSTRILTDYATSSISLAVWSEATRELTNYGNDITAADVWNTLSSTLTLQDSIGKQLVEGVDVAVSTRASQASLDVLNNISAADVWSYANRSITDPDVIWEYALTQIGTTGSIGKLLKDNIDVTISSRGTSNLTAADVWNSVTRTLTSNANFNDPDSATIAAAVWSEATRELTNYGNNITAQDVWNILSSNLTTEGSVGKQLAVNVDVAVSTRSTLTAANVWEYANRSLTDFGTLVADIWNNTTRTLTSALLGGGGQIATQADITAAKNEIIALINGLNNISSADVWEYNNRSLTDPSSIWNYALTQISTSGSIGKLLKDNIDATISSRGTSTLTANDVWNAAVRTLTANTNLGISTPAQIADAIWDEALADHATEGSTGKALGTAGTGGAGGAGGLKIETHTVSEFEQGDTAAAAVVQVLNNGVPVSGITPVGTYYKPDNSAWTGHENVNFTEIGTTGIYTNTFDTTGATLGVYKLAVSAAQSSGGSNFSDNFEDGNADGWANTGATYVVVDDAILHPTSTQGYVYKKTDWGGYHYAYAPSTSALSDFTYTADIRSDTYSSQYVGLAFRYANSGNNYVLQFRPDGLRLTKWVNSAASTLATAAFTTVQDTWYHVSIVVTGGHIVISVDGTEKINFTDLSPLPAGMVALYTYNSIASWDNIDVTTSGTSEYAYIAKDFAIVSPKSTQASINALNNISAADVWNVATSSLTTDGSIGKALADNRIIKLTSDGAVLAGSGTYNYRTKLYINDLSSQPVSPASIPSITLYDPTGEVATGPTDMTFVSTGIYSYQYTIGASANTGRWEAIVIVNTGGAIPIKTSDYFEVQSSPAQVKINDITDNTVSSIVASATIKNEGTVEHEYQYEYCVVSTLDNQCGGGDDVAYALDAKKLLAGESWTTDLGLTVANTGTYYFKVVVYWGTERSVAVKQFDAVSGATYTLTVSKAGTGSGTVSSSPSGINCGSDCSENYSSGTTVTLSASAASGSSFAGWSGDCSGTGSCVVSMANTKSVTATFNTTGGGSGGGGGGGGGVSTPTPAPAVCSGADFNHDGIVNSTDFSIMLFFWKTQSPFRNICVDINKDAQVNSVDFSILLYQWGRPGVNIK